MQLFQSIYLCVVPAKLQVGEQDQQSIALVGLDARDCVWELVLVEIAPVELKLPVGVVYLLPDQSARCCIGKGVAVALRVFERYSSEYDCLFL